MIKISIENNGNEFQSISIKGHADSDVYGKDLVCAAISAVLIGALNNLKNRKDFKISINEGDSEVKVIKAISEHDKIVIETLITSLKTIEIDNQKFVSIKIKWKDVK